MDRMDGPFALDPNHSSSEYRINTLYSVWKFYKVLVPSENSFNKMIPESHLTRTTSVPIRNTEFIGKHVPKKQSDRKGKLHLFGREGAGSLSKNSGNIGHTTPMLRRNSSNALTDSNAKKSKVSSYPAPAPAPANFAPTQLNVQNSVTSSRHSRLNCVGLMLAFIVIVICSS